jgi:hypothetical protein
MRKMKLSVEHKYSTDVNIGCLDGTCIRKSRLYMDIRANPFRPISNQLRVDSDWQQNLILANLVNRATNHDYSPS